MPAAVRRLAAIGVCPEGHVIGGIRYLDERHSVDAPFATGTGLGVRRTVLHAALAVRAAALGVQVIPARVTGFTQEVNGVTALLTPNAPRAACRIPRPLPRWSRRAALRCPQGGRPGPGARAAAR